MLCCANVCGCRENRLEGSNWIPQLLFKLFNILCSDYLIFYNELCGCIECYGLVDIIGYNELPKIYKLDFGKKIKEVNL